MKAFTLLLFLILLNKVDAQIINSSFDDWEVIQIGQPYENPIGWTTNNLTNKLGLASTPVDKGIDENGFYARITSNAFGIDATLSGKLSQQIALANLVKIEFDNQCDSLFQTGRCIVSVFDQQGDAVLYVDTIATMSDSFSRYVLPVDAAWAVSNDSIRLQFTAAGGFDMWDEMEDGFSIFMIDNVSAEYITASKEIEPDKNFSFYPNPTSGIIYLESHQVLGSAQIEILSITGQLISTTNFADLLNLDWLTDGVYVLNLVSGSSMQGRLLVLKH